MRKIGRPAESSAKGIREPKGNPECLRESVDKVPIEASEMRVRTRSAWLGSGGCGDDGFIDFRACLISLGQDRYAKALQDPDSLAEIVDLSDVPDMQSEGFQYVASKVYREKTGQDMPLDGSSCEHSEPDGEDFDFEDEGEMAQRFPRLVKKMPEMGD